MTWPFLTKRGNADRLAASLESDNPTDRAAKRLRLPSHPIPPEKSVRLRTKLRLLSGSLFVGGFGLIAFVVLKFGFLANVPSIAIETGTGMMGIALAYSLLKPYVRALSDSDGVIRKGIEYREFSLDVLRCKEQIRILSTFIWPLTKRPEDQSDKALFLQSLREVLPRNPQMEIQILFLDPYSEAAKQRAEELAGMRENAIERIQQSLLELHKFKASLYPPECAARVEVRLYDRLPPLSLYQWDNRASFSSYPRATEISRTHRFEFSMATPLGQYVDWMFWDIWTDSQTRTLDEYIYLRINVEVEQMESPETFNVHFLPPDTRGYGPWILLNQTRDWRAIHLFRERLADPDRLVVSCNLTDTRHSYTRWVRESLVDPNIVSAATKKYEVFEYQEIICLNRSSVSTTEPYPAEPSGA